LTTNKYGWYTSSTTKYNMFIEFRKDYNEGLIIIKDKDVLNEMKSNSNSDLSENNTGLVTRHFDLLIAVVIAWQMRKVATPAKSSSMSTYRKAYRRYVNSGTSELTRRQTGSTI